MRSLKILQCCVYYLPHTVGGIEIYVKSLSKELQRSGHEIKILVPDYPNGKEYPSEYENVPIITYPEFLNKSRKEFKGTVPGKGLHGFIETIKKLNPDIVHFHQVSNSNGMSIFHFAEVKKLGIPVVFTIHLKGWENRSFVNKLFEICDRIIVLSDWYYKYLTAKFSISKKLIVIKSGISNVEKHENIIKPESLILRLVYVGRIAPEKGLNILLEALKKMDERSVTLSIFGQSTEDIYYKKCLRLSQQKVNIKWCGYIDNSEVMKVISNFDYLVIPSIVQEMAPLIIIESFAMQIPVIGSDTGGIAEFVAHGNNGFLFEMGKSRSLRNLLQNILASRELLNAQTFHFPTIRYFEEIAKETEQQYYSTINI